MKKEARFWNLTAKRYARSPVANQEAYQKKLGVTQTYLRPDMRLFEFGCGTGTTAIYHAPKVKHILATDISEKMINIAKEKAKAAGVGNIEFQCAAIDEIRLEDGSFDGVLALSILHLVENKESVLRKIHKALKPGGVLVTSTACVGEMLPYLRYIAPVGYFFNLLPLVKFFDSKELEAAMTEAQFAIEYKWQPSKKEALFIVARKK